MPRTGLSAANRPRDLRSQAPQENQNGQRESSQEPGLQRQETRIDLKQSYQVAYWKERLSVSEQELSEAVLAAGGLARKVEEYLRSKDAR